MHKHTNVLNKFHWFGILMPHCNYNWLDGHNRADVSCPETPVKATSSAGGEGMDLGTSIVRVSHKCSTISKSGPTEIG